MTTYPLTLEHGHLFTAMAGGSLLLDTGAPTSFGKGSSLTVDAQTFNLPAGYVGLNAEQLSAYVGRDTAGILGGDILNEFDILIDVPRSWVSFSKTSLECDGEELAIEEFMGVPILGATIAGESVRMFFDTGAQISYFQGDSLSDYPPAGNVEDFYPGPGQFSTDTFRIPIKLGSLILAPAPADSLCLWRRRATKWWRPTHPPRCWRC